MTEKDSVVTVAQGVSQWLMALTEQQRHEWRLVLWVASLEHSLAWHEGMVLTYWAVRRYADHWRLTVKAERRIPGKKDEHRVAWFDAEDMFSTFHGLAYAIKHGTLKWYTDKYPPGAGT